MRKEKVSFDLTIYESFADLPSEKQELMQLAINMRNQAYAPYSKFKVGAAVLLENGEMVIGSNQENASYPSGLCAERVAVFQAGAKYPGVVISAIAISATSENYQVDKPAAPCGNCRQSIAEYEQKQEQPIAIFLMGEIGPVYQCDAVLDILPLAFDSTYL
jgi:cytidine deaminase